MRPAHAFATRRRGVAALVFLWVLLQACGQRGDPVDPRPNVLLVVVDTLRADHLHLYGYARRTSDTLDALGARGWVFDNHVASSGQTVPSTLSMLLSVHPAEHGFLHLGDGHFARNRPRYPNELHFLAEVFSAAGYATAGFVGNPFLQRENGFSQGFDDFLYSKPPGSTLTRAALEWLEGEERPFFVYVHYLDVHWPYWPPRGYRTRFRRPKGGRLVYKNGRVEGIAKRDLLTTISLYDAGIVYVDDQIRRLLDGLEAIGASETTVVAVTSDHGEEFLDHGGLGHGTSVYGELVRVPLVLVAPGLERPGRRVGRLTQHLDLAPTLLEFAGIEVPAGFRGRAIGETATPAFAEDGPWVAVYEGDRKLILDREAGSTEMFALEDALDQRPLEDRDAEASMLEHLEWYRGLDRVTESRPRGGEARWSDKQLEQLEALGYVE